MFFTALLFGTGVFLYYFPDDGAKIILPYLDHLHDIGVEANMKNKREKTKDSNFDQAQRLALAREYMLKAKQLFSILIALSFASSIVSGTVGVLFGISKSYTQSSTIPHVYGYQIDSNSIVVVDGVDSNVASQISNRGTLQAAGRVFFVPEENTELTQVGRVVDRYVEVLDDVPGIRTGVNVVLSVLLPRPQCDGHGHNEAEVFSLHFEHVRKQVLRIYKSLVEYGMNEGKIVFAAVAEDDEIAVLTTAAVNAAIKKISAKRSSRLEAYAFYGANINAAISEALTCLEDPSKCKPISLVESRARVMSFLASELMFAPKLSSGMSAAFADRHENSLVSEKADRYSSSDRRHDDGRRLSLFSRVVVLVTRVLTFVYPILRTIQTISSDRKRGKKNALERQLWRKYWIIFAFSCVFEDLILKNLWFILFLPAECLKLILLSKCILPGPDSAGKVYDNIAMRILAIQGTVNDELQTVRKTKNSKGLMPHPPRKVIVVTSESETETDDGQDDSDSDYPEVGSQSETFNYEANEYSKQNGFTNSMRRRRVSRATG